MVALKLKEKHVASTLLTEEHYTDLRAQASIAIAGKNNPLDRTLTANKTPAFLSDAAIVKVSQIGGLDKFIDNKWIHSVNGVPLWLPA